MTCAFVDDVHAFADEIGVPLLHFKKRERKEDVAKGEFAAFNSEEGVVFIGVAQERASALRSTKERRNDGCVRFNFYRGSVMVNHYYFSILDRDFGPGLIKLCSYFPFTGRVWLNGQLQAWPLWPIRPDDDSPPPSGHVRCRGRADGHGRVLAAWVPVVRASSEQPVEALRAD